MYAVLQDNTTPPEVYTDGGRKVALIECINTYKKKRNKHETNIKSISNR